MTTASAMMIGCGGDEGEPMEGSLQILVGNDAVTPSVGAALSNPEVPGEMVVLMGTNEVSCSTDLYDEPPQSGTFVMFSTEIATLGPRDTGISVIRLSRSSSSLNSTDGTVTIDAVGERVTGSVVFDTTDDEVGTIAVTGTFDVLKCF